MVAFARIQELIYKGYGKAAIRLGTTHDIYRSTDGINPIQEENKQTAQLISIDENLKYTSARKYGDMTWQFLPENGLVLQNYDYMVGASTTYFIGDIAPDDRLSPPLCVECNNTISIFIPKNNPTKGANPTQQFNNYGPNGANLIKNCPVALLEHTRFDANTLKLPTSVKLPMFEITMPEFDNIIIEPGYFINDIYGKRLVILSAERTKKTLGFRIIALTQGT